MRKRWAIALVLLAACGSNATGGGTVATAGSATEQQLCADVASPDMTGHNLIYAHGGVLDQIGPDIDAVVRDKASSTALVADGTTLQLDLISGTAEDVANLTQDLANLATDCQQPATG